MTPVLVRKQAVPSVAAVGLAFTAAWSLIFLAGGGNNKVIFGVVGASACVAAAFLAGNLRLFSLWAFGFSIPFDLSKRFGPFIEKMGGENSFRVEMSDPFLILIAVFQIRDLMHGRKQGIVLPKILLVWFAIMLLGIYSVLFGQYRVTAAHEVFRMVKLALLFVVVLNELLVSAERIFQCAAGLTVGMLAQSIAGLYQYITHKHLGLDALGETGAGTLHQLTSDSLRDQTGFRVGAFLLHPNLFGIFLAALIPVAIACLLLGRGWRWNAFFGISAACGTICLIGTQSRSGWVSFAGAFLLLMALLFVQTKTRRRSLVTSFAAAAALGCIGIAFSGNILKRIEQSKESAMLSRAEYIHDAMGLIRVKPVLGWGMNSYVFAAPPFTKYGARGARIKYKNWLPPVHNVYLLWLAELGVVGLLLQLWWFAWSVKIGIGNLHVKDPVLGTLNAACLAAMCAYAIDGMFSFSLRFNAQLRVFEVISAIMFAVHYWRLRFPEGIGRSLSHASQQEAR